MRFTYFVISLNTNSDFEAKSWTAKSFFGERRNSKVVKGILSFPMGFVLGTERYPVRGRFFDPP